MKLILLNLLLFSIIYFVDCAKIDAGHLKCLGAFVLIVFYGLINFSFSVCEKSVYELNVAVNGLDPRKRIDVGGYRLDADGNYNHKTISQTKSELQLSELIENVCNKMDDYVRATFKSNGTLTLIRLVAEGGLSPLMNEVDIIQDDDLNKSVKYNVRYSHD